VRRWIVAALVLLVGAGLALVLPLPWDDTTRVRNAVDIDRDPEVVFAYVTTPANWPNWHPSSLAVSGSVDHPLELGEQVTEDFLVAGHPGRAVWTVLVKDAPDRWVIVGEVDGRQAGVVTYTLERAGMGTHFERELLYSSPNLLFALLNRLRVRARVQSESAEAVRRLKLVIESTSGTAGRAGAAWSSA
jgi:uncharacterized protein YndB with AHSA1/START domain